MPILEIPAALARKEMDKRLEAKSRQGLEWREQPLYTIKEAAHYLGIHHLTLNTWLFGRTYSTKEGKKLWERVIVPADEELRLLSFHNLAEAHVLGATRYEHRVPFWAIRKAIGNVIAQMPQTAHPLLSDEFFTNGKLMFVKQIEEYVNVSSQQLSLEIMESFLVRVLKDERGAFKIYPLRPGEPNDKVISITAGVSASRPILDTIGIPVITIWNRHRAGEDDDFIAKDFEIDILKVKRAIDYVERRAA